MRRLFVIHRHSLDSRLLVLPFSARESVKILLTVYPTSALPVVLPTTTARCHSVTLVDLSADKDTPGVKLEAATLIY